MLIAIEGIDGTGKTTLAKALAERFGAAGPVTLTKEPTNGPHGTLIRAHASAGNRLPLWDEFMAFVEDRKQHVRKVIAPALSRGEVVIVDRYYYSTAAYQGARGLDPDTVIRLNESFAPRPDVLVILDCNVEVALGRVAARGQADAFEQADYLREVQRIFCSMHGKHVLYLNSWTPDGAMERVTSRMELLREAHSKGV